jgi:hypothetical protein
MMFAYRRYSTSHANARTYEVLEKKEALLGNQWVVLRLNKLDFAKSPACGRAAYETVKLV